MSQKRISESPVESLAGPGGSMVDKLKTSVINFLLEVCPSIIGCSHSRLQSVLTSKQGSHALKRFITDQHLRMMIVGKELESSIDNSTANGEGMQPRETHGKLNEEPVDAVSYNVFVSLDLDKRVLNATSVAFLKRAHINLLEDFTNAMEDGQETQGVVTTESIGAKLQVLNLGWLPDAEEERAADSGQGSSATDTSAASSVNPFEPLINYLQNIAEAVLVLQETTLGASASSTQDPVSGQEEEVVVSGNRNIAEARKKLAELLVTIQQAQQNAEVPLVQLVVDTVVHEYVQRCKAEGSQKFTPEGFLSAIGNNQQILSQLQAGAYKWVKDTQKVIRIDRDPASGTTAEEINFWISWERSLLHIEAQLQNPDVEATLAILKHAKRFLAAVTFETDTGLRNKIEAVANVNTLMRDFPINDLLSAHSINHLSSAVHNIFTHLKRLKNVTHYPFPRAYKLVGAVSRDLNAQLFKFLSAQRLPSISFEEFDLIFSNCRELSMVWDEEVRRFKEMVRDQIKKRGRFDTPPAKLNCEHLSLLERVEDIRRVRKQHQKLQDVVRKVLPGERHAEEAANRDIAAAYNVFQTIDALDVSNTGTDKWEAAKKEYNDKIDRVESQMTNKLRDCLGAAKTGTEMFRVFSQFNPLFFRPRIRGAIQEYQASLIQQVKDDIKALQVKYNEKYERSSCSVVARDLDIPQLCGTIIWYRQLERKLYGNLRRVEDVLGKGWEQHMEGQLLKQTVGDFAKKLNPQVLYDMWIQHVKDTKGLEPEARVFCVKKLGGKGYELVLKYNPDVMFLFKEVRCLLSMGIRVPYSIKASAEDAKWIYPYLITLQESIRTYTVISNKLDDPSNLSTSLLMARHRREVENVIKEGIVFTWDYEKLNSFTTALCNKVFILESKLEDLETQLYVIFGLTEKLQTVDFNNKGAAFKQVLEETQKVIGELALAGYSNLDTYVAEMQTQYETILSKRLEELIDLWIHEFATWPESGTTLIEHGSLHEFRIQNQQLSLYPPVEAARQTWMSHFHVTLGMICRLPRLTIDTATDSKKMRDVSGSGLKFKEDRSFRNLIEKASGEKLESAYQVIETSILHLSDYEAEWSKFQYLWSLEVSSLLARIGSDTEAWQLLLAELRASRATIDTSEERRVFGPIVVDYAVAQAKVMKKFEACHREIVGAFASKVLEQISQFEIQMRQAKEELETQADPTKLAFLNEQPGEGLTAKTELTAKVTRFVYKLQKAKEQEKQWLPKVEHFVSSEKVLERQRYVFPSNWIWVDSIVAEWETFQQTLRHLSSLLERHRPQLQRVILDHDRKLQENLKSLYAEWARVRPVEGATSPDAALQTLQRMEVHFQSQREDYDKVNQAKVAMNMAKAAVPEPGKAAYGAGDQGPLTPDLLDEELQNLKGVWTQLKGFYGILDSLKETPWSAVVPRRVRQGLTDLLENIRKMPAKLKQYEAFDHLQAQVNDYLKVSPLLSDMRSDALKERHWKRLFEVLNIRSTIGLSDLTLGALWEASLPQQEPQIREILAQAQGEVALEEFLHTLKQVWTEYQLELVVYKNRCKLIRGWDDLFALMDEHLNSLQSMRMSPYYKQFEEEASSWDDKLSRLRTLLESWMEVQRKWVYLEGVFSGSVDIQVLLPSEFARFRAIDNDFLAIMKKTAGRPKVLDATSTDGLQRSLDRLSDLLSKIQKALGDYLEKQRLEFPRFYFVGDEDLLEMIGNSKDAKIVQRHLNKMFAGVASFVTSQQRHDGAETQAGDDTDIPQVIEAIMSKEGEILQLTTPIPLAEHTSLNSWLRACEKEMFTTVAELLTRAVDQLNNVELSSEDQFMPHLLEWVSLYPCQVIMLGIQLQWTALCEEALNSKEEDSMSKVIDRCQRLLNGLAGQVLLEVDKLQRLKLVQLITELVHQREVCRILKTENVASPKSFVWLRYMRFYWNANETIPTQRLIIRMANAEFLYGFEYLGVSEKLVQTPLTDTCYFTLTQALHLGLGGNPFGPAGTGKTETVKALGAQLGRFVLIFCCDEAFDFQAMGRIFVGLCQVGAWGCFDEFNRLEERILSACSEQILTIQTGLKSNKTEIELMNKSVRLHSSMGIFVTMNPGYAGRSNLPDNLKQLFREMAMINPDKVQITEVLLYSQGFQTAERLAGKVVALFDLCSQQLSSQRHYDFGLRSLKSVLSSAGNLKRNSLTGHGTTAHPELVSSVSASDVEQVEQDILLRSICNTMVPKLVAEDVPLLQSLLQGVFPGASLVPVEEALLEDEIRSLCHLRHLECRSPWLAKVLQLYQIQKLNHGVMLVGPVGTGKSTVWKTLLDAMERLDGLKGSFYLLDPKTVPKEQLYGRLDPTTLEWTDGVFTALLRKILNSYHGTTQRRHWIVFDGDVDPEWAENLNSVLDDNKLLTLPNGERLQVPENVRLFFEVDDLRCTTLATVSRCGMVWFSTDILSDDAIAMRFLSRIRSGISEEAIVSAMLPTPAPLGIGNVGNISRLSTERHGSFETMRLASVGSMRLDVALDDGKKGLTPDDTSGLGNSTVLLAPPPHMAGVPGKSNAEGGQSEAEMRVRRIVSDCLQPYFEADGFVIKCLNKAAQFTHIMDFTHIRALEALFSIVRRFVEQIIEYNDLHSGFGMDELRIQKFVSRALIFAICWGAGGSMGLRDRVLFSTEVAGLCDAIPLPQDLSADTTLLDYEVRMEDGEWHHWRERVVPVEIDTHQVQDANLVVETVDTVRHRHVLGAWMEEKKPFILCGPPGSGKTMTLTSTLKNMADVEIASLNFSSGTTPELLLKTFDHYCEYVKTTNGLVLRPSQPGKWLIIFADEINLPQPDAYGTQKVIMFIRMMQEYNGFWKMTDRVAGIWSWVKMERIQFAGACNPPTDAGRHPMSNRFLRHAPLLFVDFPGPESLKQIYSTFNRALLRRIPNLRNYSESLTNAMVDFYVASQEKFTVDQQPHYIYSPRELTRWKVALYEALNQRDHVELRELVRLYVHEGLRIFQDRLVEASEREWTDETIDSIAMKHFPGCTKQFLERPILYCCYLSLSYEEAPREELRELISGKLRIFNEEELNVQLVLFDQVLDHITRIDRVLRQPLGHLLLVGASGAGKTVLSKFVSWLNGLSVFQIKAGRNYDTMAFENDLRTVMKRSGLRDEKITFIFDESNALGPAFLERMNALLASGEVPGLFEGDDYTQLILEARQCFGAADSGQEDQELFTRFTKQVQKNLHIVFTMNPANPDFSNRQATSPALFNRCVIDWFGDWPHEALLQVASAFIGPLELSADKFTDLHLREDDRRANVSRTIVAVHEAVAVLNDGLSRTGKKFNYLTPRDFLDFIQHFIKLVAEKENETVDNTKHINVGLTKLKETELQVAELQESLAVKEVELHTKSQQAEEKMQLIIGQQAVAEERKNEAQSIASDLDSKSVLISKRRGEVETELKLVEPLLRQAESAVSNIPKRYLDELRALANPPQMVKFAVEAVVVMLNNMGNNPTSWEECRKVLKGGDFINRVITFDSMSTSPSTVQRIKQKYLDTDMWDVEKILRASSAAGPLASWVQSSIDFQVIAQKVEPLRSEIQTLEKESAINTKALEQTQSEMTSLEATLQSYKSEYAQLITDVQMIKQEMDLVQHKVRRSSELLNNLTSEKTRWSMASESSKDQLLTAVGDCLLAAAFIAYMGFFEHADRSRLINEWKDLLEEGMLRYRPDMSVTEFLSKPSERFSWTSHGLPTDDLSVENAIILRRYIRYPLIIDPSGQANSFLISYYANEKLVKTSFLDPSFFKNLESCIRFGTPLLVQDVEKLDPILNSVLNRETHKAGGRVLITVGDSDIDFSPTFKMFLITRDPTAQFTPDLCSRVTFVNFTLTPSSLQNQCLNLVLKSERPEVDKRRSDILKLQGEFRVRIRELEEALLFALSNVKGNILDDENVITTLENLKAQAAEVEQEVAQADAVFAEVEKTSEMYRSLSEAAARVFFTLQSMQHIAFFYQYDLQFFESAFRDTLKATQELKSLPTTDYQGRLAALTRAFFSNIYSRCAVGIMNNDRIVLALQLARIFFESETGVQLGGQDLEVLFQGSFDQNFETSQASTLPTGYEEKLQSIFEEGVSAQKTKAIAALSRHPPFAKIVDHIIEQPSEWCNFLSSTRPELAVPAGAYQHTPEDSIEESRYSRLSEAEAHFRRNCKSAIRDAILVKVLRPDALPAALSRIVELICGKELLVVAADVTQDSLYKIVTAQLTSTVPVILIAAAGFDPGAKILTMARNANQHITSIALGSEEGYAVADKAVAVAARQGTWVLLKNVHLAAAWLQDLEKKLFRMFLHENFRIFLTMELSPKVPRNLFRVSFVFYFEPPAGLRASMERTYDQFLPAALTDRAPSVARGRLLFLLALLHAIVLERKRYIPFGWSKHYEFSDADLQCGITVVNQWLDRCAVSTTQGQKTALVEAVDPSKIPFDALRMLLTDAIYGGRLDNSVDKSILSSFVQYLFSPEAFESDFVLSTGYTAEYSNKGKVVTIPSLPAPDLGRSRDHYVDYVLKMNAVDEPLWLGLPPRADRVISARQGAETLIKWLTLHSKSAEDLQALLPPAPLPVLTKQFTKIPTRTISRAATGHLYTQLTKVPAGPVGWLTTLQPRVVSLLQLLPPQLLLLQRSLETVQNPMFRFYDREISSAARVLKKVRSDLEELHDVCEGQTKFTNFTRELARHVQSGTFFPEWASDYSALPDLSLGEWFVDFSKRVAQLALIGLEFGGGCAQPDDPQLLRYQADISGSLGPQGVPISQRVVWLGGLQFSKAFLTATRQLAAQKLQLSLDELVLRLDIGNPTANEDTCVVVGLTLENASWNSEKQVLEFTDTLSERLPPTALSWIPITKAKQQDTDNKIERVNIPIFYTANRANLVTMVELPIDSHRTATSYRQRNEHLRWHQRGVAITLWTAI